MNTKEIRNSLREGNNKSLKRRRWIALLSAIGLADFGVISLYQVGFIRHLPDLPGKIFDSDTVNASEDAYQMGLPDGPVSAGTYALNLIFGSIKGTKESGRPLWADVALAGTVLANAIGAVVFLKNMITIQKKVCPYCIAGALINFASVPFALAEVIDRLREMKAGVSVKIV